MKNPIPKLRQSFINSEKPVNLFEKLNRLKNPATTDFNIFCWNFAQVSYSIMSTKGCSGFFFILFGSWVINKNVKNECVEPDLFNFRKIKI